jgi:hypothetical protein
MAIETRVYIPSTKIMILVIIISATLAFLVAMFGIFGSFLDAILILLIAGLSVYFSFNSKVVLTLSIYDISFTHFEQVKKLKWEEIVRINKNLFGIWLYNKDETIVIPIYKHIEGFSEIQETIKIKCPGLLTIF